LNDAGNLADLKEQNNRHPFATAELSETPTPSVSRRRNQRRRPIGFCDV
jgi:hypothetical protein